MEKLQNLPFKRVEDCPRMIDSSGPLMLFITGDDKPHVSRYLACDCTNSNRILLPSLPPDVSFVRNEILVYDASTKMHKVLVYTMDLNDVLSIDLCYITSFSTKFVARANGWRMIRSPFVKLKLPLSKVTIRGILYWLVSVVKDRYTIFIQPFNIAEEKFLNPIRCPDEKLMSRYPVFAYHLLECRGSLGFMLTTGLGFQLWILKDSSSNPWIRLHKVCLQSMISVPDPHNFVLRPVFVLENLKSLTSILLRHKNKHFWYEMNGQKVKKIDVDILPAYGHCLSAWFS